MGPNLVIFNTQRPKLFRRGRQGYGEEQNERETKILLFNAAYLDMALHSPTESLLSVFLKWCCQHGHQGYRSLLAQTLCNPTLSTAMSGCKQFCKPTQSSRDLPQGAGLARSLLSAIPKHLQLDDIWWYVLELFPDPFCQHQVSQQGPRLMPL